MILSLRIHLTKSWWCRCNSLFWRPGASAFAMTPAFLKSWWISSTLAGKSLKILTTASFHILSSYKVPIQKKALNKQTNRIPKVYVDRSESSTVKRKCNVRDCSGLNRVAVAVNRKHQSTLFVSRQDIRNVLKGNKKGSYTVFPLSERCSLEPLNCSFGWIDTNSLLQFPGTDNIQKCESVIFLLSTT
jgi:hypothetical protein